LLYLDVYNILHVTGVLPAELAGIDLAGLLRLLGTSRYAQHEIVAVCDGVRPANLQAQFESSTLNTRVLFSGDASDADGLIEKLLAATPRSKKPLVVSSDHRLRRAAGKAHARHLRSEVFLHHLAIDHVRDHRGTSKQARLQQQARPAFATDIPLDRLSTLKWLSDLEATSAEIEAMQAAERMSQTLAKRLIEDRPPQAVNLPQSALPPSSKGSTTKSKPGKPATTPRVHQPEPAPATDASTPQYPLTPADQAWLRLAGLDPQKLSPTDLDMNFWLTKGPSADTFRRD
jgi:hypothetical protein